MITKDQINKRIRVQPIEVRLFYVTLVLTVSLLLTYCVYGFIIGYLWPIQSVYTTACVGYATMLALLWRGRSFRLLSLIYYYIAIGLVVLSWIPSGGLQGGIIRFVVMIFFSGLMVLHLRDFLGFCVLLLVVVGAFSFLEFAEMIDPAQYTDQKMLLLDLIITNLTMLLVIGLALYYFKKEYLKDRKILRETNIQLGEEKAKAQAADKAKTEFLATISHDMRTPLNGIVGISDLLKDTKLDANQQDLVGKLQYSSNLLNNLISDVLDLTLIESGKLALKEESFQLKAEVTEILNLVESRLKDKADQVELKLNLDAAIPTDLKADIKRIRQILINFLVNAIKYTEKGFITLRVEPQWSSKTIVMLKFNVADTGIGIPKERQALLFSKFYKAHDQLTIEGTGLGLSIAKSLAEHMGGEVGFTSEPDKGSNFFFTIPVKYDQPLTAKPDTTSVQSDYSQLRVLVAEDQDINLMVTKRTLESIGISDIACAMDGEEVVSRARERVFDVILMDLQMPKKNGIDAAKEISQMVQEKSPVIIALTANVMKEDVEACLKAGMKDFISKPFKKESLLEVFKKHLK